MMRKMPKSPSVAPSRLHSTPETFRTLPFRFGALDENPILDGDSRLSGGCRLSSKVKRQTYASESFTLSRDCREAGGY